MGAGQDLWAESKQKHPILQEIELSHSLENRRKVQFPEKWPDQFERAKFSVKEMKNLYRNSNRKTAHIIVSHGSFVKSFAQFSGGARNRAVDPIDKVQYCGVSAMEVEGNNFRLMWNGNNDHI